MGVLAKLHGPLFHACHEAQTGPISNASADELATFVRGEGIDAERFKAVIASPEVDALMQRARDFAIASGLRGTPTPIVDGKYRVQATSHPQALQIAQQLAAHQPAAPAHPTPTFPCVSATPPTPTTNPRPTLLTPPVSPLYAAPQP